MADIALPRPKSVNPPSGHLVTVIGRIGLLMLLFYILASINWSAVLSKAERCEVRGAFNNDFSRGFDIRRRICPAESPLFRLVIP
jgi:hypothetical protein